MLAVRVCSCGISFRARLSARSALPSSAPNSACACICVTSAYFSASNIDHTHVCSLGMLWVLSPQRASLGAPHSVTLRAVRPRRTGHVAMVHSMVRIAARSVASGICEEVSGCRRVTASAAAGAGVNAIIKSLSVLYRPVEIALRHCFWIGRGSRGHMASLCMHELMLGVSRFWLAPKFAIVHVGIHACATCRLLP